MTTKTLSYEQALEQILSFEPKINTERIRLEDSLGRIASNNIESPIDIPPFDNSAMDGFAVNSHFVNSIPSRLPITNRIKAGDKPEPLKSNSAARIFTGAMLPKDANCVVIQENCEYDDQQTTVKTAIMAGDNIRQAGQDIAKGELLIRKGQKVHAAYTGLLASAGITSLAVSAKINAAIISSGHELVSPGQKLPEGKIFNSNSAMLNALTHLVGAHTISSNHVEDNAKKTCDLLEEQASKADLIITTGGVSVGEEDHIHKAVGQIGSIDIHKVAIKPGKPLLKGQIGNTPIIGLPGNPSSVFVTFLLFVAPLIKKMQGQTQCIAQPYYLPIEFTIDKHKKRTEFLRVKRAESGLKLDYNQSSGALKAACLSDGLARIDTDKTFSLGELIRFYPYSELL